MHLLQQAHDPFSSISHFNVEKTYQVDEKIIILSKILYKIHFWNSFLFADREVKKQQQLHTVHLLTIRHKAGGMPFKKWSLTNVKIKIKIIYIWKKKKKNRKRRVRKKMKIKSKTNGHVQNGDRKRVKVATTWKGSIVPPFSINKEINNRTVLWPLFRSSLLPEMTFSQFYLFGQAGHKFSVLELCYDIYAV